ncbi:MAG: GldG family protein [Rhodospirillales bacterium]|nr:GldG family protein [Rhodospirillales bacterium]
MQYLQSMDRKKLTVASLVVAALFLFFLNILVNTEVTTAQVDLTDNKLYTLSKGTKSIIGTIKEPLTLRFYFTRKFAEISPGHGNYANRVRELLETYALQSGGKIKLKLINPEAFSVEEDEAVKLGIQGVPLDQSGELGYFGMAATNSTDDRKSIAFFDPQRERFLEYDLTRIIFELTSPEKKKVGLMSSLLIEADPLLRYQPWPIVQQISQFFEIKSLDADVKYISDDIAVLLLVHPKISSKQTMYAIDQFIMRGGRVMALVDPHNETARMSPQLPPGAGKSTLEELFKAWGIEFNTEKFIGDRNSAVRVSAQVNGRDVVADYLSWNVFDKRNLNSDDVLTAQLTSVSVASAGALSLTKISPLTMTPLLQTSPFSQAIDAELVRTEPNPATILKQFKSENKIFTLAARFSGKVKSAFPDGPPAAEIKKGAKPSALDEEKVKEFAKNGAHIAESKNNLNMVVIADSDLVSSRFWLREQDFFGQKVSVPLSNNADLVVNALDNLSGSDDLIHLRSRGFSIRPFYKIVDLKNAAEDKYRDTETELSKKLVELQKKVKDFNLDNKGANVILSAAQRQTFKDFRLEMLSVRKQLRDVQHALRKDIDSLDTTLKIVNIWLVPVIVAFIAIMLALFRRRRYAQQVTQG